MSAQRGVARMQLDTLRLRLLKVGGRVLQWLTRVRLHLASSPPASRSGTSSPHDRGAS